MLPNPDARQRRAVEAGEPALLRGLYESGNSRVYLVRRLPNGAWVYAEIASAWLWSGASEFAADASLLMLADAGQAMASAGTVPPEWRRYGLHIRAPQHDRCCDFRLHYQPIVSETSGGRLSVEALVRWPGKDQTPWVPPAVFVPVAEENGAIVQLGEWILRRACEQFARWRSEGLKLEYMSVNVSMRQLSDENYMATLNAALADSGMQGNDLQIEITESVLAHGAELEKTLVNIAALGVRLALDDFGTGYSSLSYLRNYPIHTVKIDRSFVLGLPHDLAPRRLAESIIVMCGALGKKVIAEGVETQQQLEFLRRAGCTTIQGYLLGRPMEAADIPGFARRLRSVTQSGVSEDPVPAAPRRVKNN